MKFPKIVFPPNYPTSKRNEQYALKLPHKDLLAYGIRMVEEEEPMLSPLQAKAKGVQQFLLAAGINVLCVDSHDGNVSGLSILNAETKDELAFIKTNSVLINMLYDLYFDGAFLALDNQEDLVLEKEGIGIAMA